MQVYICWKEGKNGRIKIGQICMDFFLSRYLFGNISDQFNCELLCNFSNSAAKLVQNPNSLVMVKDNKQHFA